MTAKWVGRVPWKIFFLMWFLAAIMGGSLLWIYWGLTFRMAERLFALEILVGAGLLWATTRPQWQKSFCAWCGGRVHAQSSRVDSEGILFIYSCFSCGQVTEKRAGSCDH